MTPLPLFVTDRNFSSLQILRAFSQRGKDGSETVICSALLLRQQRRAEVHLHVLVDPTGVAPLAGADSVLKPVEREAAGNRGLASVCHEAERHVRLATLALDVERAVRTCWIAMAYERDSRILGHREE